MNTSFTLERLPIKLFYSLNKVCEVLPVSILPAHVVIDPGSKNPRSASLFLYRYLVPYYVLLAKKLEV